MWADYQLVLAERGVVGNPTDEDEDEGEDEGGEGESNL
jgi:hypothetical protein